MMRDFQKAVIDNYGTYTNAITLEPEKHFGRLALQFLIAILCSLLFATPSEAFISVVVTALSVFAGFAFSAMFPIAAEIISNLRPPQFSEDKDDIEQLRKLTSSFRANISYFIPLSLFTIMLFVFQLLQLTPIAYIGNFFQAWASTVGANMHWVSAAIEMCLRIVFGVSVLFLFEALYTFYRMCLAVLFILRIRDEYQNIKKHK